MRHDWDIDRQRLLEGYLDGELAPADLARVDELLRTDARFREESRLYHVLFSGLAAMPLYHPPVDFDARILAAVLPRFNQEALLVRTATRIYLGLSVGLGAMALALLAVLLRGRDMEATTATGLTGAVDLVLGWFAFVGTQILGAAVAVNGILSPLVTVFRPMVGGLFKAAEASAPAVLPAAAAIILLAVLVFSWALGAARKKGLPHVSLSL